MCLVSEWAVANTRLERGLTTVLGQGVTCDPCSKPADWRSKRHPLRRRRDSGSPIVDAEITNRAAKGHREPAFVQTQ